MAAGVENAEVLCCFLTPKYQDSVACKDELTYAKERGVCIIPIRLIAGWKPTGWLGFTITGHKWIDFRDIDTNIDVRIEQLIKEIQMLVGNRMDCFQGMEFNHLHNTTKEQEHQSLSMSKYAQMIREQLDTYCRSLVIFILAEVKDFDSDCYYRFTTQSQGPNKALDIVNDGRNNNKLKLATTGNYSGQLWRITSLGNEFYRLTTQWQGDDKSLDIVNDGKKNNQLILGNTSDCGGQHWKITALGNGYCRLTSQWLGDGKSLSIVVDGRSDNQVILADTTDAPEQYWRITPT